jgi:hypothetical protein
MPQVIANAIFYVAYFAATQPVLFHLALSATLSIISSKLFGPKIPDSLSSLKGISVMRESAIEYRNIVYGEAAVAGPVVYKNVSGTNREYLWYVVALADGEIEDLVSVYVDEINITKAQIAWSAGSAGADGSGTGNVSTSELVGASSTKAAQIFYTLGHADQVANGNLVSAFTEWTGNHRLRGISYIVCKFLYNEDTDETLMRFGSAAHPITSGLLFAGVRFMTLALTRPR